MIIAASASAFDQDKQASITAGCDAFITKPVNIQLLFSLLEKHLPLEWTYEVATKELVVKNIKPNAEIQFSEMILPPQEILANLHDLVFRGDMRKIKKRILEIEQMDEAFIPFTRRVYELANKFEDKKLLVLFQEIGRET